ncbi:hypothetical protein A2397_04185 [Candidatus Amesbacteria bacterium RIFOXYB1_FULL_44_23]|uniref:HTH merR-type domain-containing protein n=1 Tax=Candidatus Amesbacteria bacterium RIFOXYB1_FULL_44_23 TaxID=1797263 RepID=A0A1F4ZR45_9BACT|nr:MAG: hypothetical protein A2397_04185 [Candidatus Amesbacteria bacterium RIFOXYB1_FULL_44_23]
MDNHTIGQTAKITGLSPKTIRFYEESGVITPATRGENGYRAYTQKSIEELKVLKYARDLGLPLSEIKKLMRGCEDGNCAHSRNYILDSITNYLKILDDRLGQMQLLRSKLNDLQQKMTSGDSSCNNGGFCCDILHQLVDVPVSKKGGDTNEGSD